MEGRCILKWILILRGDDISWAEQKSWHNEALPTSQFGFWRSMMKSCQFWHEDTSRLDEQKWEPLYHTNMANGRSFERSKSPKYLNFLVKKFAKTLPNFPSIFFKLVPINKGVFKRAFQCVMIFKEARCDMPHKWLIEKVELVYSFSFLKAS